MTHKAQIYRVRRTALSGGRPVTENKQAEAQQKIATSGGAATASGTQTGAPSSNQRTEAPKPANAQKDPAIEAIRSENLSGRQLGLAWRISQHLGIRATGELDAVRKLREAGVDPFDDNALRQPRPSARPESTPLGTPPAEVTSLAQRRAGVQLPQRVQPVKRELSPTNPMPAEAQPASRNYRELREIQLDIARRRQKKLAQLVFRLSLFVLLPTLVTAWYYFSRATPMYTTNSAFLVISADEVSGGAGGGGGGLFGGSATPQEAQSVQDYLTSRNAMIRLDEEYGFIATFSGADIDPLQRLPENATNEDAFSLYKRVVQLSYDLTEGVLRLTVVAPDPEASAEFSRALIRYAEEVVDQLSKRKRDDQISTAEEALQQAQELRRQAAIRVAELESFTDVIAPEARLEALQGQLGTYEADLQEQRRQLSLMQRSEQPNPARVRGIQEQIRSLEEAIIQVNRLLITEQENGDSLTERTIAIAAAKVDLEGRDSMVLEAVQGLQSARIEAARQVRFLSTSIEPVAPDAPSHPKPFENSLLAFLIFFGIYLMLSVTVSILKEQVSA